MKVYEVDLSECTQNEKVVVFIQEIINDPISAIVKRQVNGYKATMLVRAPSHRNRLFIFDTSHNDCTVRDLMVECAVIMNQDNISFSESTVYLVNDSKYNLNYIVDINSRSADNETNSDNDHTDFTYKSIQEILSSMTSDVQNTNFSASDKNSNTFFKNTEVRLYLNNLKQKGNHVSQNIVRPTCSNTNTLHVRSVAEVPSKNSKTPVRVQDPKMNCLYQQNSSQRQQQISNTLHPVQSSPNPLPSCSSVTPTSVQQRTQQVSISPQTQQIQKQPLITSPASSAEQNKHVITSNKMEIDLSECKQKKELTQHFPSLQLEHKKRSNNSVAYLEKIINDPKSAIVQQQVIGKKVKMLVILDSEEQRLITFDIPIENCTVHDLLVQVRAVMMNLQTNISFSGSTISLVNDPELGINYIVDVNSRSAGISSDNNHTNIIPKSIQEIISSINKKILSKNTNALAENSNTSFTDTEIKFLKTVHSKNLKQKVDHVGQNIPRPTCSNTNMLHVRPAAKVSPKILKTSVEVQDPEMNCLNEQNSSQQRQQLSNTLHPVQSSPNLPSRRSITPNSVQQETQQVSITPQTEQIQKQPIITSPAPSAEHNKHVITSNKMEVDISECKEKEQEKELITQQSSSLQLEYEKSSGESVVYIQETIINDPTSAVVQQQVNGNKAKMLVITPSGIKNKLITFDTSSQHCTVHDLLVAVRSLMINQINISISESTVFLLDDPALDINYVLDVNSRSADTHSDLDHTDFISKST